MDAGTGDIETRRAAAVRMLSRLRPHGAPPAPPPPTPIVIEGPAPRPRAVERPEPAHWPQYCCAILRDAQGRYLMERRSERSREAPGKIACFGGKRDAGEHPDRCLRRELKEELNWSVGALRLELAVRLMVRDQGKVVAWFYRGRTPRRTLGLKTLPGCEAIWLEASELATEDVSDWHRAALEAESQGLSEAWIER